MGRYYFHIRDGQALIHDEEGTECADLIAVLHEATCSARDVALAALRSGSTHPLATIEIEDEYGNVIANCAPPPALH